MLSFGEMCFYNEASIKLSVQQCIDFQWNIGFGGYNWMFYSHQFA